VTLLGGFFVEDLTETLLAPEGEGGEDLTAGGRGPLAYLAEAVVWHRAYAGSRRAVQPARRRWYWRDAHPGRVLVRMLEEARARRALPGISWDFTRDRDSDGEPWAEAAAGRFDIPIGVTYLELVDLLREAGLTVAMGADLVVHAWDAYERDVSGAVEFAAGVDITDTVTRQPTARRARSVLLLEGEDRRGRTRHRVVRSRAIRAALGRRKEGFSRFERTATLRVLRRVGRRKLRRWSAQRDGAFVLPVAESDGKVALVDYTAGDTVGVHIPPAYDHEPIRIASVRLGDRDDETGEYDVSLEMRGHLTGLAR
jgi:hypothetical protein